MEGISVVYEAADNFELPQGALIADVHFTADGYADYDGDPIRWTIYRDTLNGFFHPGTVLDSGFAARIVANPVTGSDFFDVWFDLDNPVLWPGGRGWLGLHMPGEDGDVGWTTTDAFFGGVSVYRTTFTSWTQIGSDTDDKDLAFKLSTVGVPEPSSCFLLGGGLLSLLALRRKFTSRRLN